MQAALPPCMKWKGWSLFPIHVILGILSTLGLPKAFLLQSASSSQLKMPMN